MKNIYTIIALGFVLMSCNNQKQNEKTETVTTQSDSALTKPLTFSKYFSEFNKTDSLEFIFYDNPDGDSLRYTRFYTYNSTNNKMMIDSFVNALNIPFDQQQNVKPCRSLGKIHLYNRENPLKTIYFSNRGDTCSYLYAIKDGNIVYTKLPEEINAIILKEKKSAKKP